MTDITTPDLLATIAGLRQKLERVTQERDRAEAQVVGAWNAFGPPGPRTPLAETAEEVYEQFGPGDGDIAEQITSLEKQLIDAITRAERAEAENARLRSALEPFARLAGAVFRVDEDGRMMNATKADEAAIWGFDREEITYGGLRAAIRAMQEKEG